MSLTSAAALRSLGEALRESFWFIPGLMALLSAVGAYGLLVLDSPSRLRPLYEPMGADGARAVLSAIVGSMITVTGVVFSAMVVALSLTSSQFGPRLLRTFSRDRGSQFALGTFLATFCYSLLVLPAVRDPGIPNAALVGAIALAIASLIVLIFFIHRLTNAIQASDVIASAGQEIRSLVPTIFSKPATEHGCQEPSAEERRTLERLDEAGAGVRAQEEGYVRMVDERAVLELASRRDLVVRLLVTPGQFVDLSCEIARVWPPDRLGSEAAAALRRAVLVGTHRTVVEDLLFPVEQLSEMAVRALSPGVNDPKTAVQCLHRLGGLMAEIADRPMPVAHRYDEMGALRIARAPLTFEAIAAGCFDAIRRAGSHDPKVVVELLRAVGRGVGTSFRPERRRALRMHAREIYEAFGATPTARSQRDRAFVDAAFDSVSKALGG